MCGICGIYNFGSGEPVDRAALERMNLSQRHRGPDEAGLFLSGDLGLAMSRLSIMDLTGGSQPLENEDGSVRVVVNGEIYNYPDLKAELESQGHVFRTGSDSEAVVHLYEQHGPAMVSRLEGMFGLAVWDEKRRRLILARDHIGIKPLHYRLDDDRIIFGSEMKAVLAVADGGGLDEAALSDYLSFLYTVSPATIHRRIRRLPPGCMMIIKPGGARLERYWRLEHRPDYRRSEARTLEELDGLLAETVRAHLMSDVDLAVFLSGGLDSTLVTGYMARAMDQPVRSFTIGFDQSAFDERPQALAVARALGADHTDRKMDGRVLDLLPKMTAGFDEPFADYGSIPLYNVSRLAAEGVKVALAGDGGDEMFGGYQTYYAPAVQALYRRLPGPLRRGLIEPAVRSLPTSFGRVSLDFMAKRFVSASGLEPEEAHYLYKAVFDGPAKRRLLRPGLVDEAGDELGGGSLNRYRELYRRAEGLDTATRLMNIDIHHFLVDNILVKSDRMSMAHSLEVRVPLCDRRLMEFAATIPGPMKVRINRTKRLFRALAKQQLPPEIALTRKKGFSPPLARWLVGPLKDYTRDALSPANLSPIGLFNTDYVTRVVEDHMSGRRDNNRRLWALLVFVQWWYSRSNLNSGDPA